MAHIITWGVSPVVAQPAWQAQATWGHQRTCGLTRPGLAAGGFHI